MTDNSTNEEFHREMTRGNNEYFNPNAAAANYQHILPPAQYFTQQMYYPYVNPYSHLTEANGNLAIHGYGSDGRPRYRRSRTIYNPEQLDVLEHHFEKYKYPDIKRRKMISEEIGLPEERVQIWFQNRRAKDKRHVDQQVKLQQLVDEAIGGGGAQEMASQSGVATADPSLSNHISPVEHLNQLQQQQHLQLQQQQNVKVEEISRNFEPQASCSKQGPSLEYIDSKEIVFPEPPLDKRIDSTTGSQSIWPNSSIEAPEPQVAIQNIDQDLLFKVANILSASNDAAQLISEWSQSPNKLPTTSLEEQLRHFAEHNQKVLTDNMDVPSTSINIPQCGLNRDQ